ncbi:MAG: hypothetical protein H8E33_01125 [Candidatus Cloacimonetes bacterium]|nr:hypothetical protein [Candidatus Cloacimonadota bacterium]
MKKIILFLSLLIIHSILISQISLDPRYHTYSEIKAELDSLQELYPDLVFVDSIGVTSAENIPIWAVKISDNASIDEDEPAVMYAGQCHAEEVLGVEITMWMINEILEKRFLQPYSIWISQLEIWFIPSYNPEGLQVVMDGWDTSFRKNKRDNNLNDNFDFIEGPGNDIDGIDLNRNYSFNWIHGDTLWAPGTDQLWDYYRGPAPFSEGGTQAVRDLAEEQHFIFSINWHSSRTGNFSEKVFYSFEWDGEKRSPDFEFNQIVGETVASFIQTEDGTGSYEPSPSRGRKGSAHDWFYQAHGTTQLLIECGTSNLQPDSSLVDDTCERCSAGAYWLLNRIIGYNADMSLLTGHITDVETDEPLVAEIIVEEKNAPFFAPRLSDETYGRYWRQLLPGTYTLKFQKKGYEEFILNDVTVNNSTWTVKNAELVPLSEVTLIGTITSNDEQIPANIKIYDIENDEYYFENGNFNISVFEGIHKIEITSENCVPFIDSLNFSGELIELDIELAPENVIFSENWENGSPSNNWQIDGNWNVQYFDEIGDYAISLTSGEFYTSNENSLLTLENPINLQNSENAILSFQQKYYTEHDYDICAIQLSSDAENWDEILAFSGIENEWQNVFILLTNYLRNDLYLRLCFTSDETINDPGWWIKNIKIITSDSTNFIYGDVDGNGSVTSFDAALTLQYSAGLISNWTDNQIIAGDVNGDDNISSFDAALILQYSAGIIDEFPVENKYTK